MVPEAEEEVKPKRQNEEEQQGFSDVYVWLLLVLASALLPGRAEWTAGAGAPSGSTRRSKRCRCSGSAPASPCLHLLQGSDRTLHRAGIPEGNPVSHLHVPPPLGDVAEILVQAEYTYWGCLHPKCSPRCGRAGSPFRTTACAGHSKVTVEYLVMVHAGMFRCGMQKEFFPLHESADVGVIITPSVLARFPYSSSDHHVGGPGPDCGRSFHPV